MFCVFLYAVVVVFVVVVVVVAADFFSFQLLFSLTILTRNIFVDSSSNSCLISRVIKMVGLVFENYSNKLTNLQDFTDQIEKFLSI